MRLFGSFKGCSIKIPPVRDGLVVLFLSSYKGENKMTPKERLLQMHIDWFPRGKWYRYGEKCTWIGKKCRVLFSGFHQSSTGWQFFSE